MDENEFENLLPETNKEYRVKKINPELSCSICPPNRGENSNNHNYKLAKRRPKQKRNALEKSAARKFKKEQHREIREE